MTLQPGKRYLLSNSESGSAGALRSNGSWVGYVGVVGVGIRESGLDSMESGGFVPRPFMRGGGGMVARVEWVAPQPARGWRELPIPSRTGLAAGVMVPDAERSAVRFEDSPTLAFSVAGRRAAPATWPDEEWILRLALEARVGRTRRAALAGPDRGCRADAGARRSPRAPRARDRLLSRSARARCERSEGSRRRPRARSSTRPVPRSARREGPLSAPGSRARATRAPPAGSGR